MRVSLLWNGRQHRLVLSHRHFETIYRSHLQGSNIPRINCFWPVRPLKMETIGRPETSGTTYQCTLRNVPETRRSYLHGAGNLKSHRNKSDVLKQKKPARYHHVLVVQPSHNLKKCCRRHHIILLNHDFRLSLKNKKSATPVSYHA